MENTIKDYFGRPINVGDRVIYACGSASYYYLSSGIVTRFNDKNVWIGADLNDKKATRKLIEKVVVVSSQYEANHSDYPELYI